jgi:hypothetical protein
MVVLPGTSPFGMHSHVRHLNLTERRMKTQQQPIITPGEARAIAKEAYIYGFPLVDNYLINSAMTSRASIVRVLRF